ncbi:MAG: hypothetical protein ACREKL_02640, partial [Chthoniobacterales bacterium]
IMMSRALDGWPWPEGGFDNYERYSIPAGPPVVLEQPWQMVPDDGAHVSVDLETYANYSGDFHAASTAPQSLDVKIGTEPADFYGTSAWLTLKNTGGLSDNDYVHFFAQDASSQVKVLRASRLTAKNFTVQPYKVICPTTLHAPDPDSLPSSQELQEDLNRIYRQMNITFTVKPYKTITVDYDIGPAIPAGPLQPFVPNMKSNVGNPQNGFLDATVFEDVLTREENAVYNEEYHSTDNASLYFLGDVIRYHDFVGPVNAPACRPIYGYTRRVTHRAIISFLKDKPLLLHTAAHEIGHMNIGVNGKGLYHPRLDDGRGPNSGNPAIPAYPLMRLSDDRKRLMFPHPTSLEYLDMGQPARYPAVLLYDEWKRYRGE